jgi:hypothetical protein
MKLVVLSTEAAMRPYLLLTLFPLLACQLPGALASTVFKCVDADGSITYSNEKCEGKAKVVKTLTVAPPPPVPLERVAPEEMDTLESDEVDEPSSPRRARTEPALSNIDKPRTRRPAERKLEVDWPHEKVQQSRFDKVCKIRRRGDRC